MGSLEDQVISMHRVLVFIPQQTEKEKGIKIYNLESDMIACTFRRIVFNTTLSYR